MDTRPDWDGRYRVNDFFCHDDTWRTVLSRLANECDAVLMDLRGFSRENTGCVFEIQELVRVVPLNKVVLIIDNRTDEESLRAIAQRAAAQAGPASPNRSLAAGSAQLFRFTTLNGAALRRLLCALAMAVAAPVGFTTRDIATEPPAFSGATE
jgi:hypothetical protein